MSAASSVGISTGSVSVGPEIQAVIYAPMSRPPAPANCVRAAEAHDTVPLRFGVSGADSAAEAGAPADMEQRIAEESKKSFEAGRQRGHQEGVLAEREAQRLAQTFEEKQRGQQMAGLTQKFDEERERYLHAIEHEVVDLALAIAARILRREAQMDPLLLTGAVRVALGQLADSTRVRLRVPATDLDLWKEAIAYIPNLAVKPELLADDGMLLGECAIETELGSADLGIRSQLGEIERGFFDQGGRKRMRIDRPEAFGSEVRS